MRYRVIGLICLIAAGGFGPGCSRRNKSPLWPETGPFRTGYLKVSDIHEIYYELSGNPEGRPVFALHGGPGGGSSPYMRRFFNPKKFLIVLYDQRGAGKSRPFAETRENTTAHLVDDIEKLRRFLDVDSLILFGGSWGSTLALAYAETYPSRVRGMILRGVFAATKDEIDHFYHGGVVPFFPDVYQRLAESVPERGNRSLPEIFARTIAGSDTAVKNRAIRAWAEYEIKISGIYVSDAEVEEVLSDFDATAFSTLENHYMAGGCFLEEGQLFRDADRIAGIPLIMVNGRYDMICPPVTAWRLHQRLPESELIIVENAGHWMGEPPIEKTLVEVVKRFE